MYLNSKYKILVQVSKMRIRANFLSYLVSGRQFKKVTLFVFNSKNTKKYKLFELFGFREVIQKGDTFCI